MSERDELGCCECTPPLCSAVMHSDLVLQAAEAERVSVALIPDEGAVAVKVELRTPSTEPAAPKAEEADVKMEDACEATEESAERASSQQTATTSGRNYVPGAHHMRPAAHMSAYFLFWPHLSSGQPLQRAHACVT